ncbi:MAG TPA: type II toxin-antitoxin system HipA family toxin [Longimicrobiales bacterium]|nr:type II toxin-antitoxin system HipA family toxin [Longimicrobiales bacterium]
MTELRVLLDGEQVGVLAQRAAGELVFTYERSWRERNDSFPISLSMPLAQREHRDVVVRPFLEGLLPDNANILERWARRFQVSARNPFALLSHMGEDCAGAVQFVRPERYQDLAGAGPGDVAWLSEGDLSERLRDLVEHQGMGRLPEDRGHFSLAGAQPKMPLFFDGARWGIPSGRLPTTHILKPSAQRDLGGLEVNEHLCLRLAKELGLAAVESWVETFGKRDALVVARYDRVQFADGRVVRLHQEDACQSLGVSPHRKYQNEGGPGPEDIVDLLIRESDDPETDVAAFLDALALNWVIGGTDAHAKNYSLLLSAGSVRLAPLYDVISILPYPRWVAYREAKLAMSLGREYGVRKIRRRHWEGLAVRCDLDPGPVIQRVAEVVTAVPAAVARAAAGVRDEGVDHEIVDQLEAGIRDHSTGCLEALAG